MALALFDMDGTLVNGDTNNIFFHYLRDIGLVDDEFIKPLDDFHERYFKGELKIEEFVAYAVVPLKGKSRQELSDIVVPCIKERIVPRVKKGALETICFHRERGDNIVVVSATVDYIVKPLADEIGINHVIAAPVGFDSNGCLTGNLTDIVPNGSGKRIRIKAFLNEHDINLCDSYAYGDSINDIEMLDMAEHRYAIDANEKFREHPYYHKVRHASWL